MDSKFAGMKIMLGNTKVKFVFPTKMEIKAVKEQSKKLFGQHIHYDVEIHFFFSGNHRLVTPQQEYALPPDSVCLIPPNYSHQILKEDADCDSFNALVSLRPGNKEKQTAQLWNGLQEIQVLPESARICQYIKDFREACAREGEMNERIKESLLTLAFCMVTEELTNRFPNRSKVAEACKLPYDGGYFDAELENYLMIHYKGKLSREAMAKHLGISSAQLGRIIHRNYGMNFSQLITRLRMVDAKKLLQTDKTITEIGRFLGYTTYNGFAVAFKKYYGVTPESMRKEYKQ